MDNKSLEKNLANMERELLNLQTAHDIGLGAMSFFQYEGNYSTYHSEYGGTRFDLLIDIEEGERTDPIFNIYVSSMYGTDYNGFDYTERVSEKKFIVGFFALGDIPIDMYTKIISSSRLRIKSATSIKEVEEWLNG